jgi:iron complex outermembrane recepter protein
VALRGRHLAALAAAVAALCGPLQAATPVAGPPVAALQAQPLDAALKALAAQARLNILYVSKVVAGRDAPAVPAGAPPAEALRQLLAGSGLEAQFLAPGTVRIVESRRTAAARAARSARRAEPPSGPAAAGAPALDDDVVPDDITITATKRAALQERVPLSVYVLRPEDIELGGMTTIADVAAASPSLDYSYVSSYGPGELTGTVIRGIGSNKGSATTGIYLGDMPLQMPQNPFRTPYPLAFDMQRVELLRGPQGTLFGADAMGGALRYIPQGASLVDAGQSLRAQLTRTDEGANGERLEGMWAQPLLDGRAGVRLAAAQVGSPGYVDHVSPFDGSVVDEHANRVTARLLHLALVLAPTPALRLEPDFYYQATHLHDSPVFYLPGYTSLPDPTFAAGRPFSNGRLLRQPLDERFWVGTMKLTGEWDHLHWLATTSWLDRRDHAVVDETNGACLAFFGDCGNSLGPAYPSSPLQAVPTNLDQHQTLLTAETRLSGEVGPFSWLGGLFFSGLHTDGARNTYLAANPGISGITQQTWFIVRNRAAFGQLRWQFAPRWAAALGTRVGSQDGESTGLEGGFANNSPPYSHGESPWAAQKSDPRIELEYEPAPGAYYYAAVAKGTREGGSNGASPCGAFVPPGRYGSDAVWNYELGAKLRLLDEHLRVAGSVFQLRWDGVQSPFVDACGDTYVANAGAAISQGFDLDAEYVARGWSVQLALAYLDAHYTRTLINADGKVVVRSGDALGGFPALAPPWSGRLVLRRRWPHGFYGGGQAVFQVRNDGPYAGRDASYADPLPSYARTDAGSVRFGLHGGWQSGPWDLRLAVDNATARQPTLQGGSDATGFTPLYGYTWPPRTWRLSLAWQR